MPILEFTCDKCKFDFEIFGKSDFEKLTPCPACGTPARRMISRVNFNFASWMPEKKRLIADALGDDVPVERIPDRPFREI